MALPDMGLVGYTSGNGTSVGWEIRGAHRWAGEREREKKRDAVVAEACTSRAFSIAFRACVCVCVCVCGLEREMSLIVMSCVRSVCVLCARGSQSGVLLMWRERSDRVCLLFVVLVSLQGKKDA